MIRSFAVAVSLAFIAGCNRSPASGGADIPSASSTAAASASSDTSQGASPSAQLVASSSAAAPLAAGPFEGEIQLETYPFGVLFDIQGDRARAQMIDHGNPTGGAMIVDRAAMKLTTISASNAEYSELDMKTLKPKTNLVAVSTGRKDAVLGHACDVLLVVDGQAHREICLARDVPPLAIDIGPTSDGQGFQPSFGAGFPLRIAIFDSSGKLTAKMEATRIEAKHVPSALLTVPAQAKKVTPN